jgi:hypothetical protein
MLYVEIFGNRKFRENFAKTLRPKTHTPKVSRNFRPDHRKFGENFESPSWIYDKVDFQSVSRRPGGPETQTNVSINGGLRGAEKIHSNLLLPHRRKAQQPHCIEGKRKLTKCIANKQRGLIRRRDEMKGLG